VPFVQALAPTATLQSHGYGASEGPAALPSGLLEAALPDLAGPVRPASPALPMERTGGSVAAGNGCVSAAAGQAAANRRHSECGTGSTITPLGSTATTEAYVLLPHVSSYYEFLHQESGELCRWGQQAAGAELFGVLPAMGGCGAWAQWCSALPSPGWPLQGLFQFPEPLRACLPGRLAAMQHGRVREGQCYELVATSIVVSLGLCRGARH